MKEKIYRFLRKNFYVIGKGTHVGQIVQENATDLTMHFLKEYIKLRTKNNYDWDCILNCDEMPVNLDNPYQYTLPIQGKKIFTIKTFGKERNRISCLLSISAYGDKLKPFIVFKGQKNKNVFHEIKEIKENKIIGITQSNAGVDEETFIIYIKTVLKEYKPEKKNF